MPTAITVSLAVGERAQLERLVKSTKDPRLIFRGQVVLMSAGGKSVREIRQVTGFQPATITKWRKRYVAEGAEGLYDRLRPGGKPKVTPVYLNQLRRTVMRSPRKMGYAFTVWTGERLAEFLAMKTGIRITGDWVLELLKHQLNFSHQRPKHTLKGKRDEKKYRLATKELETLKKGLSWPIAGSSCGTKTRPSSISIPTSRPSGLRVDNSPGFRRRAATRSGPFSAPLTTPRARSTRTSARRKGLRVFMTW